MTLRLRALLLAVTGLALADGAAAQTLTAPDEVVIYVHKDMQDTDFVDGLVCELGRVLVAPVRSERSELPLYRSYLATQTQLDVGKVEVPFDLATASHERVFRYLLLPYDLKAPGLNYVFSNTFLDGRMVAVMSTIRLVPRDAGLSRKKVSDVTSDRIYKLMLKSVALLAGLRSDGCIMKFPRDLPELDKKPAEFCPEDREALVAARVVKEKPYGACNTVAMLTR
jgi:predicted Zn-dependent protease